MSNCYDKQIWTAGKTNNGFEGVIRQSFNSGMPMKEAISAEKARHNEAKGMRLKHLEDHYKR